MLDQMLEDGGGRLPLGGEKVVGSGSDRNEMKGFNNDDNDV